MTHILKDFNIKLDFNFEGKFTGNSLIEDEELKKVYMFSYITDEEQISATCSELDSKFDEKEYIKYNIKNFKAIGGKTLFLEELENKYVVLMEINNDKVLQIYFTKNQKLYCFSATLSSDVFINKETLTTNSTSEKLFNIISSMEEI